MVIVILGQVFSLLFFSLLSLKEREMSHYVIAMCPIMRHEHDIGLLSVRHLDRVKKCNAVMFKLKVLEAIL